MKSRVELERGEFKLLRVQTKKKNRGVSEILWVKQKRSYDGRLRVRSCAQSLIHPLRHASRHLDSWLETVNKTDQNKMSPFIVPLYLFQVVKAFIVLNPNYKSYDQDQLKKEIQEHVKKATAPYKYPRKVSTQLYLFSIQENIILK